MAAVQQVRGEVVLPADAPQGTCTLRVSVEDVTRLDAASLVVAAQVRSGVGVGPGWRVPFAVPVGLLDPTRRYVVRAHLDRAGDATVAAGDWVSTHAHPLSADEPLTVSVVAVK